MSPFEKLFQPNFAFAITLALALSQYAILVVYMTTGAPGFVLGGDFVAFWSASREVLEGRLSELYSPEGLQAAIETHRPNVEISGLTWQYPPHASLIFSPIGLLPYAMAYAVWSAAGLALFAFVLHASGLRGRLLIAVLATIPVLTVLNTGQNALFTCSLLLAAVTYAKPKPIIAGLAAALLTLKPQLGILLPVVFLLGRDWRAFGVAAFGSVALWGGSALIVGADSWMGFFQFLGVISGSVSDGVMPLFKMVNVYAASRLIGLPEYLSLGLATAAMLLAIGAVAWTCRATEDPNWRYAVVATATLLAAPYSMYYEIVLLVPAVIFVLVQGAKTEFLNWERETIAGLVVLTLVLPGPATQFGLSLPFLVCFGVAVLLYRRLRKEFGSDAKAPISLTKVPQTASN